MTDTNNNYVHATGASGPIVVVVAAADLTTNALSVMITHGTLASRELGVISSVCHALQDAAKQHRHGMKGLLRHAVLLQDQFQNMCHQLAVPFHARVGIVILSHGWDNSSIQGQHF